MLNGISKILTGDILKVMCDMGHGDYIVIADANFPAQTYANKRLLRLSGIQGTDVLKAMAPLYPVDTYTQNPVIGMDLTDSDKEKGMPTPVIWSEYNEILKNECGYKDGIYFIDRYDFYDLASKAYAIIQTGEERQYGNLIIYKGVIL